MGKVKIKFKKERKVELQILARYEAAQARALSFQLLSPHSNKFHPPGTEAVQSAPPTVLHSTGKLTPKT